jgi:hypothetical protein
MLLPFGSINDPREPRRREARGDLLCAPRLADPLGSLLPLLDPFGEPGQVGPAAMHRAASSALRCHSSLLSRA